MDDYLIAIIDDDALVLDSVGRLVRSMGFNSEQFFSVEKFLAFPFICKACCIISDVNMPDGNTSRLRDRLAMMGHDVPIIFMTGRRDRALAKMLMDAGAVHVLAKPFLRKDLEHCIAVALQRNSSGITNSAIKNSGNEPVLANDSFTRPTVGVT